MQDRWVSYIFRYRTDDNKRCENSGYVKLSRTSRGSQDEAKLRIGLKCYKPYVSLCKIYMVYDGNKLALLDELKIPPEEKGIINQEKRLPWRDFVRNGTTPKDYDGVVFINQEGELMAASWPEKDIDVSAINTNFKAESDAKVVSLEATTKVEVPIATAVAESYERVESFKEPESLEKPDDSIGAVGRSEESDEIENILKTHIKLPQLMDSPFTRCVKIIPQDIGRLPISNWKLGQNSFLTHSYYKYKYLMLGIIELDLQKKYIIGVPGVYSNKERYLANMFGFSQFIPAQRSANKTGSFGYWVWEVLRQ